MGLYGMHQSPLAGLPSHQMSQQMFSAAAAAATSRRPPFAASDAPQHCVGLASAQRSNPVQTQSTVTPGLAGANSNPWMLPFTSQSAMEEFSMNMPGGLY